MGQQHLFSVAVMALLAGCGGGGPPTTQPPPATSYATLNAQAQSMAGTYQSSSFTTIGALSPTGTARFAGYFGAAVQNGSGTTVAQIIGDATIDVALSGATLSSAGQLDNIFDQSSGAVNGSLPITTATLNRAGDPDVDPTFRANARGRLTWSTGLNRDLDLILEGDLLTPTGAALAGDVIGRQTASNSNGNVIGTFIGTR